MTTYQIHPRIGVARLGNSTTDFYLAPDEIGGLPLQCDDHGNATGEAVTEFKDSLGAIKRQAARFRIFAVDGDESREVVLGDDVASIEWTVHIANKKPVWYTFSELQGNPLYGEGNSYENQHVPVNNPQVTDAAERQTYIIDPGPRSISQPGGLAVFDRYDTPEEYPHTSFPSPDNGGQQIDVLGELRMDEQGRLIALGGYGKVTGSAQIDSFRGAANYWDDIADGYVVATLTLADGSTHEVDAAWLIVGSPKYVPEIVNVVTLADTAEDVAIRYMGSRPDIYDAANNTADAFRVDDGYTPLSGYNPDYRVNFDRDVKPVMDRLSRYKWVAHVPTMDEFSRPWFDPRDNSQAAEADRRKWFSYFRQPLLPEDYADHYASQVNGPAQLFAEDGIPLMPVNSGDNSVTNDGPIDKFMTLTPTLYFYLLQWADGKFDMDAPAALPETDRLDRVDIGNCVGAPFSPGIEITWNMRCPAVYANPMQIRLAHAQYASSAGGGLGPASGYAGMAEHYAINGLSTTANETEFGAQGCEPGDLTKRMAIPWMADFHECTVQTPNITNIHINQMSDGSGIEVPPAFYVYWWPPQSPFNIITGTLNPQDQVLDAAVSGIDGQPIIPAGQNVEYQRGIDSAASMIANWATLGFIVNRGNDDVPYMVESERGFAQLAQYALNTGTLGNAS